MKSDASAAGGRARRPPRRARRRSGGQSSLLGGAGWNSLSQFLQLAINLGMTPYVIHGLGDARYSVFLLISAITNVMGQFDGGIGQSALRFFTIYAGRKDEAAATRLIVTTSAIISAVGLVIFGTLFVIASHVLTFFKVEPELWDEALLLLRTITLALALLMIRNMFNSLLFAHQRFRRTATATLCTHLVYVVGIIATVQLQAGLYGVTLTFLAQQLTATLIIMSAALPYLDLRGRRWMSRAERSEFFNYAWKVQISGLITLFSTQKDQIVAGRILSAQQSGPFGQGSSFAYQLRMFPLNALSPIQAAVGQEVGQAGAGLALSRARRVQRIWVRFVTCWCVVGAPATYFGVSAWLPDSFEVAADVAVILLIGHMFTLLPVVLVIWALSQGHPEVEARCHLVGLAVNIVASVVLGLLFGILGVVTGSALAGLATMLFLSYDTRRKLPVQLRSFVGDIPWIAAFLSAGLTTLLELVLHPFVPRGPLGLLSCGLMALPGALCYCLLVFGRQAVAQFLASLTTTVLGKLPLGRRP